jgi:hypothetical protein
MFCVDELVGRAHGFHILQTGMQLERPMPLRFHNSCEESEKEKKTHIYNTLQISSSGFSILLMKCTEIKYHNWFNWFWLGNELGAAIISKLLYNFQHDEVRWKITASLSRNFQIKRA